MPNKGRFVLTRCGSYIHMPWEIRKKDSEFCVHKRGNDTPLKCYPTRGKAVEYLQALYANEDNKMAVDVETVKAKTKKIGANSYPASDFLVVEDLDMPSKWHLQVKKHGKMDAGLMGGAHAALMSPGGHRGNKYAGPDKEAAIAKLKKMYKQAGMTWPEDKKKDSSKKSLNLMELESKVHIAIKEKLMEAGGYKDSWDMPYCPTEVFMDFAIVKTDNGLYQVPYEIDAESYEVTLGEPIKVKVEYVPDDAEPEDDMDADGALDEKFKEMVKKSSELMTIKSIGPDRVGGYAVLWGDESRKDLTGEWFTPKTEELTAIFDVVGKLPFMYHHGLDETVKTHVSGVVDTLKPDSVGLWYEAQLKKADEYDEQVKKLIEAKKLKTSTQTFPLARRVSVKGEITRWPIAEITGTPTPAEYRMQPIETLKSAYQAIGCKDDDFACMLKKYGEAAEGEGDNQGAEKARLMLELEAARLSLLEI